MSEIIWDGKGLPPAGTIGIVDYDKGLIECDIDRFIGLKVKVIANFKTEDGSYGIVIEHKNRGIGALMYYAEGIIKPIKSERDNAIEEMVRIFNTNNGSLTALFGHVYDAGYRKVKTDDL